MGKGKRKAGDGKNSEQSAEPELNSVTDTDYHTGSSRVQTFREIYEDYMSMTEPEREQDAEIWRRVKKSCMHFVAARPALFPYHDMTRWVLSKCRAKGIITKADGSSLISYAMENVAKIYGLPNPECIADESFVTTFCATHSDFDEWLEEWWYDRDSFKATTVRTCRTQDFHPRYRPVAIMFCRLFGEKNCNSFRKEWIPFMHAVVEEGKILNWASLLAEAMLRNLKRYMDAAPNSKPPFYMSAYLLDMALAKIDFASLKLNWEDGTRPIQELFSMLWMDNYIPHFYNICDKIMSGVHVMLFGHVPPRISKEAAVAIKCLGHWYLEEFFTIIRIAGNEEVSYLPRFVPDRVVLREIAHQTVGLGAFARLQKHGKRTWPSFPISIGMFSLQSRQHAEKEAEQLVRLQLCKAPHRFFDPNHEVFNLFASFKLLCPEHQPDPEEERFEDIFNYVEKHKEIATREVISEVRFRAINIMEDLFQQRDALLHGPPEDISRLEVEREKERKIKWDKFAVSAKRMTVPGSRKVGILAPSMSNPPKQAKTTKEDTGEKEPKGHEETVKKQRTDDADLQTSLASTILLKKPETLIPTDSEKQASISALIDGSSIIKDSATQNPDRPQGKPESETTLSPKRSESQNPESERTQKSQGGSETEKPPEQSGEKSIVTTPPIDPLLTQPTDSEREQSEIAVMSRSDLLITSEVEEDNTIVSVGDYSFHTKSKAVMRRRTKRAESVIVWTAQGEKPEERSIQSASALGAFAMMNLNAADDTRQAIEALRTEVITLTQDLHRSSIEQGVLMAKVDQGECKQRVLIEEKEDLQAEVEDLRLSLEKSRISRADMDSFLLEAVSANDKGLNIRKAFLTQMGSIQSSYQGLLYNEELLNQQAEELQTAKGARRKIAEYQKKHRVEHIKRFSLMELKYFQVMLNTAENLTEEAGNAITDARKECRKIWDAARALSEKAGLARIEEPETTPAENLWTETAVALHQTKEQNLKQIKELRWEHVKALIEEARLQTQLQSWCAVTKVSLQKKIMKGVCQSNYTLEKYDSESFMPVTEAVDQWETFFDKTDPIEPEAGSSSVAPEVVHLDVSD